jgi:two-component system nitrate/nitrite sensor histidine kinase NarX
VNTVMPLAHGPREATEERAATARERRRLAAELERRFAPVLEDLIERVRDLDDEAAVHSELTVHAVALRRWVEGLTRGRARGATPADGVATERLRLARRLHDTALQLVEYVVTDAYGAGLDHAAVASHLGDALAELRAATAPAVALGDLRREVEDAIADARRLGLDAVVLEGDALEAQLAGADLELVVGTIREALTNVRKHARARQAVVRVERAGRALRVTVEDDGVGTDHRALRRADGLGLRESIVGRGSARAATIRIHTAPGAGTRVTLTMPQEVHRP